MSLKLTDVCYTYMKKTPYERQALKTINLEISRGEYIAVIGHTGSGKSTLMQQFNGLLQPDTGLVELDGIDINSGKSEAKQMRRNVGMVFQYPEHQIFAETVFEDVAFGPRNKGLTEEEVVQRVEDALRFVHLDYEEFSGRSPFQLSGGQMRRLAIAGVIALNPDYLILDEPSAGLDPRARDAVFNEIRELYEEKEMAVILVTHSMEEAAQYAGRILVMEDGEIVADAAPKEIFRNQRELLERVGVGVPQTVKLCDVLRKYGMPIKQETLETASLVEQIKELEGLD